MFSLYLCSPCFSYLLNSPELNCTLNFDVLSNLELTYYLQILTGEDWNVVMYDGIEAYGGIKGMGAIAALYFIILFVAGNFILLNVFLAIAVDNLSTDDDEVPEAEAGDPPPEEGAEGLEGAIVDIIEGDVKTIDASGMPVPMYTQDELKLQMFGEDALEEDGMMGDNPYPEELSPEEKQEEEQILPEEEYNEDDSGSSSPPIPEGASFFIFKKDNKFRILCHKIQAHPVVGNIILVCILVSSAFLACEDPLRAKSEINVVSRLTFTKSLLHFSFQTLGYFDYFFTTVFTLECSLKLITYGFLFHKEAFCRIPFNILDVVVVTVSLISIFGGSGIGFLKILRVLRVLRPLRAINRAPGLKQVVQCMIVSVKSIGNIMAVTVLLIFMFGVIGVQLFKGKFFSCTNLSMDNNQTCQGEFITFSDGDINKPIVEERQWVRSEFHYDNIMHAMLTLFVVATFEGWPG